MIQDYTGDIQLGKLVTYCIGIGAALFHAPCMVATGPLGLTLSLIDK